ncbi:hypothetical protein BDV98DRAFT_606558 [Pterulicium gracile]|uniref:BTB domain-containing protein n=1 Tax=Pterulicium gracile TaxID=1884261 RepID=A0A5C3QK85_9AGAR|nr:hypothetical protein BDV98DRAFT_606558 [Pterula gracilis]
MFKSLKEKATADTFIQPPSTDVCFHVHRDVLAAHSSIFVAPDDCAADPQAHPGFEVIDVTEVQPDLKRMEIGELVALAEAVEKYDVHSMKQLLRIYTSLRRDGTALHPFQVFARAVTHGYKQLAIDAAVWSIGRPREFKSPEDVLSGAILDQWVRMREVVWRTVDLSWALERTAARKITLRSVDHGSYVVRLQNGSVYTGKCSLWGQFCDAMTASVIQGVMPYTKLYDVQRAFEDQIAERLGPCDMCQERARKWLLQFMERRKGDLQVGFGELDTTEVTPKES